ncbi:MAG: hypothetical protein R3D84_13560 [Paracoccaceae bacterium]
MRLQRAPEAETAGRVRLSFVEAEGDYELRAAETVFFPDEDSSECFCNPSFRWF